MNEAAKELWQHIKGWASDHDLSSEQIVIILARMIGNYEKDAFEMAAERRESTITRR